MIVICLFVLAQADGGTFKTKEEAIDAYIKAMETSDFDNAINNGALTNYTGMDVTESDSIMTLEEAEKNRIAGKLNKNLSAEQLAQLERQQNFVTSNFGVDAWKNVSYTLTECMPQGRAAYVMRDSEVEITESEYEEANLDFWKALAEEEGLTVEDILATPPEGVSTDPQIAKAVGIFTDNVDRTPAAMTVLAENQFYEVHLQFNGTDIGEDESYHYMFVVSDMDGGWKLYSGLQWEVKESIPTPEHFD